MFLFTASMMCQESSSATPSVPLLFFESLVRELGRVKPHLAGNTKRPPQKHTKATQTLQNWITELRRQFSPLPPNTLRILLEFLFPEEDNDKKYGLQESKLANHLADIFHVSTARHGRGRNLKEWTSESSLGCLGLEVENVMSAQQTTVVEDNACSLTMSQASTLLTELAASCPFSSTSVREAFPTPRRQRAVLHELYSQLSPSCACLVTQIILKDLGPLLYPLHEIHYSASLLKYNSNAFTVLTKEDAMMTWDPSGRVLRAFKVQGTLLYAAQFSENMDEAPTPHIGIPISIPKCLKGQGCGQALSLLSGSKKVWAETKYDGERAQIHVEVDASGDSHIKIFSKSKRDSTLDRFGVHSVVRDALGLSQRPGGPTPGPTDSPTSCMVPRNIVLEAEMVAFSDTLQSIDEFWRIRSLIATTALGPRHVSPKRKVKGSEQDLGFSQDSMSSNASDGATRHLALVFFDVLVLDSVSLLRKPYSERRAVLESVITVVPGYAMLADRAPIPISSNTGESSAKLREVFAQLIANHEEGLVLKADESRYNQGYLPWVKLKRDYIPGYGDTLDLAILGAAWDKDRARELRVSPAVYTTFYLGTLSNAAAIQQDPTVLPHFEVIFTCSYGLSREKLEELNFIIKTSDYIPYTRPESNDLGTKRVRDSLPYTCNIFPGLHPPSILLCSPILAEVFGAGFTKAPRSKFYELRFPRISKVFRRNDRSWLEGTTLTEFQKIAREVVGRDRPGKDVDDWCDALWGKPSSPGIKSPSKRKQREEEWIAKLEDADRKGKRRRIEEGSRIPVPPILPLRPLGSVTNFSGRGENFLVGGPEEIPPGLEVGREEEGGLTNTPCFLPSPSKSPPPKRQSTKVYRTQDRTQVDPPGGPSGASFQARETRPQDIHQDLSAQPEYIPRTSSPTPGFLRDAVVWIARPSDTSRPPGQASSSCIIPTGQQLNTLDSLLLACGWQDDESTVGCGWVQKGIIFVDDEGEQVIDWRAYPLPALLFKRAAIARASESRTHPPKPVWVFSSSLLLDGNHLDGPPDDVESRAICKLG